MNVRFKRESTLAFYRSAIINVKIFKWKWNSSGWMNYCSLLPQFADWLLFFAFHVVCITQKPADYSLHLILSEKDFFLLLLRETKSNCVHRFSSFSIIQITWFLFKWHSISFPSAMSGTTKRLACGRQLKIERKHFYGCCLVRWLILKEIFANDAFVFALNK